MIFNQFPVDEQHCKIRFESFGHTVEEVRDIPATKSQLFAVVDGDRVEGERPAAQSQHLPDPVLLLRAHEGLLLY